MKQSDCAGSSILNYVLQYDLEVEVLVAAVNICKELYLPPGWTIQKNLLFF